MKVLFETALSDDEIAHLIEKRETEVEVPIGPTAMDIERHHREMEANNFHFVTSATTALPQPTFSADIETVNTREDHADIDVNIFKNPRFAFLLGQGGQDEMTQVRALRSTMLWAKVDIDSIVHSESINKNHSERDLRVRFEHDEPTIDYPYIIVGVRSNVSKNTSELLLAPATPHVPSELTSISAKHSNYSSIYRTNYESGPAIPTLYRVSISTKQKSVLMAMKQTLFDEPFTKEDLDRLRDDNGVVRFLHPDNHLNMDINVVEKPTSRRQKPPVAIDELDTEDFDVNIIDEIKGSIPTQMMQEFEVPRWLHRASILLRSEDKFHVIEQQWKDRAATPSPSEEFILNEE